jgi:outer membrane immunogenic protein
MDCKRRKSSSEKGTTNMPKSKLLCTVALLSSMLGLPMAANAADLGVRPPPPAPAYAPPPPPFSWTGFYIGGNLGAGWNHGNVSDSYNFFNWGVDNSATFVGGGQVGGNYQFSNLVVGVEADFDWFANNNNSGVERRSRAPSSKAATMADG